MEVYGIGRGVCLESVEQSKTHRIKLRLKVVLNELELSVDSFKCLPALSHGDFLLHHFSSPVIMDSYHRAVM